MMQQHEVDVPDVELAQTLLDGRFGVGILIGIELAPLPCVVTVNGSAAECRPRIAKRLQQYKYAASPSEKAALDESRQALLEKRPYLNIEEWGAQFVNADPEQIGMAGSPTKVKNVESVVFTAKENLRIDGADDAELDKLMKDLIANHTIG